MPNRFHDADNVTELIGMLVGAGSVCWENLSGAGVFDDAHASRLVDDGIDRLIELGWA